MRETYWLLVLLVDRHVGTDDTYDFKLFQLLEREGRRERGRERRERRERKRGGVKMEKG